MDTGTIEAGKAILKFYRRTKGNQENTGLKKGKSLTNKANNLSMQMSKKNSRATTKGKKEEEKTNGNKAKAEEFKLEDISTFLEKGENEEIRNDPHFNVYREMMNEKHIAYNRNLIIQNKELADNQFTWFRDPNFKIEDSSSEEIET
uniref:Uncharacterized protein n=1 Tax=Euplotes crassus TaxID=5936 RepID=A0A7S3K8Z0_EUPCR|mmetsp:Transcript_12268/g.12307  ORF Transcript_12268/g.12307 Transcript_12268/m.12307 type:complete len:147 (+) Transcript_12268:233-673(+)